jgi:hypothetical protein
MIPSFMILRKNINKTVDVEGKVDAEHNCWTLSLDTEIFCELNNDTPSMIHFTDKINVLTYSLF